MKRRASTCNQGEASLCSRCGAAAPNAVEERDLWRVAPPISELQSKRFHSLDCVYSQVVDRFGGPDHPVSRAVAEHVVALSKRSPQYVPLPLLGANAKAAIEDAADVEDASFETEDIPYRLGDD